MVAHDSQPSAYSADDIVWLCLTTLHHRRFVEDAIHLAGLPAGSRVRLRYRKKYISRDLWDQSLQGTPSNTTQVLVALAATDSKSNNIVRPLRQATIVSARCEGSVLVLDVSLGAFLSESGIAGEFWDCARIQQLLVPDAFGPTPQEGMYLQKLNFHPVSVIGDNTIQAWECCADGFFEAAQAEADGSRTLVVLSNQNDSRELTRPSFGRVPFLYHLSMPRQGLRWKINRHGGMSVEAGAALSIEVHTYSAPHVTAFHNPAGEIYMDVSNTAASFTSSRRVRIDSRRDVREVRIATSALFRRSHGHLSIRTVVFSDGADPISLETTMRSANKREEVVIARHDFPLTIGNVMPVLASLFVSIAAGVAVFKIPPPNVALTIRDFAIPFAVTALAFAGLLLGLRKDAK